MIVNGVIVLRDKNKVFIGEGLKIIKKGNGLSNVKKGNGLSNVKKGNGLSNIKKYGSGLKILK